MDPSTKSQSSNASPNIAEIGAFRFDRSTHLLSNGRRDVPLTPKASRLLALLVEHREMLVSREQIYRTLWPEGFIQEGNLTQNVYLLRRVFASDPNVHIENIPRRGYRLRVVARERSSARVVAALLALVFLAAPAARYQPRLFGTADESYRTALYHLDRPMEHALARVYFERTIRTDPAAPQGYAGLALMDAMYAVEPQKHAYFCKQGVEAAAASSSRGASSIGSTAQAMLFFICGHSVSEAKRQIAIALSRDPRDWVALNFAARISMWTGERSESVAYAERAVSIEPASPETLATLGLSEFYAGRFPAAAATLTRALEIMPDDPVIRTYLAAARHTNVTPARDDLMAVAATDVARGNFPRALRVMQTLRKENALLAEVAWLYDYRFGPLRARYAGMARQFRTIY